ncbi:hypothetical protein [Caldiplasma sukawensis]
MNDEKVKSSLQPDHILSINDNILLKGMSKLAFFQSLNYLKDL